ncbi:unnamed protein product [Brachionus calyciflorus]|uniref:Uncharacterized protein n=1 Tax=Brachionus calyciflorus TaxID=104777 RepID=A0A814BK24_9BILA|nr:unnamed protein product [Brachionus calyciflorus]
MILFAEWLNLNRFYLCDDDIDQFYIYDPRPQFRMCRTHPLAASKAFAYMCHVMDWAIDGLDVQLNEQADPLTRKQILGLIQKLGDVNTENEEAKDLIESILFDKSYVKQKDYLFYLLRKLEDEGKEIEKELKDLLLNERAKVLGQVGLWNQNANSMRATITSRLQGNNRTTHAISKIRYQLVLYNMHAMNGIHPISDDALFEETLREQDKDILCSKIENKNFDNKDACRAARQGYRYSDKAHVYYRILNRVTGYLVYYFSFTIVILNGDLISASGDISIKILDTKIGLLKIDLDITSLGVNSIALFPNEDLASSSPDETIRIWTQIYSNK